MAEYNAGSKMLHRLALGQPLITEASFDLEWNVQGRNAPESQNGLHVFVTGLARAGTTILLKTLYESGAFCSLTYKDMPFVLAPNLWSKLTNFSKQNHQASERAHKDGILIGLDSPEALEEVFWRVQTGGNYIKPNCLTVAPIEEDVIVKFRQYVSLIMKRYGGRRYLSKNNNNILRIPALCHAFPQAKIIVPFRDPIQHAISLLRQHQRFTELQQEDLFAKRYMAWLVHHEFGIDQKPFTLGNELLKDSDANDLDYWLKQWIAVYRHILDTREATARSIIFFHYDRFCSEPDRYLERLSEKLDFEAVCADEIRPPDARHPAGLDDQLRIDALRIHEELAGLSLCL